MTVESHAGRPATHLGGCVGFWLWALAGAGLVFGMISFIVFFLIPPVVLAVLLLRRSRWNGGAPLLGLIAGAGVTLLAVAGLNWSEWHDRTLGDNVPNPFYWGGVGLLLLAAGIVAYAVRSRRN